MKSHSYALIFTLAAVFCAATAVWSPSALAQRLGRSAAGIPSGGSGFQGRGGRGGGGMQSFRGSGTGMPSFQNRGSGMQSIQNRGGSSQSFGNRNNTYPIPSSPNRPRLLSEVQRGSSTVPKSGGRAPSNGGNLKWDPKAGGFRTADGSIANFDVSNVPARSPKLGQSTPGNITTSPSTSSPPPKKNASVNPGGSIGITNRIPDRPQMFADEGSIKPGRFTNPFPTGPLVVPTTKSPPIVSPPAQSQITSTTPPLNQVRPKLVRQSPPKNEPIAKVTNLGLRDSTETDAQQATEAAVAGGMLDTDIAQQLINNANANPNDPKAAAAQKAWNEVIRNGSRPEDIAKFQMGHGAALGPKLQKEIDLRGKFAQAQADLQNGNLTAAGKDQALASIQQSLKEWKAMGGIDPKFSQMLSDHLTSMQQFNDLGKLADAVATGGVPDPFGVMLEAITVAEMPVALLGDMIGVPVMDEEPLVEATAPTPTRGAILHNPVENGEAVNYTLDSYSYTMRPATQQALDRQYTLSFDRGNGETRRYTLSDGTYYWRLADGLWELQRVTINVGIDNTRSGTDFRYLANGQEVMLRAGETVSHAGEFPIEIVFDRGDGGEPARKLLHSGSYVVAIDADPPRFDLFPSHEAPLATARFSSPSEPQRHSVLKPESNGEPKERANRRPQRVAELLEQIRARRNSE